MLPPSAPEVLGRPTGLPTRSPAGTIFSSLCLLEWSVLPLPRVPVSGGVGLTKASAGLKELMILHLLKRESGMDAIRKQVWTKPKGSKVLTSSSCDLPLNQMAKDVLRGRNVQMFGEQWFVSCKWPWHVYKKWAGQKRNPNSFSFFFLDRITKLMDGGSVLVVK